MADQEDTPLTNYVAYQEPQTQRTRIGHYDLTQKTIQPLSFKSGTPIDNLYQVIEAGEPNITRTGSPTPISTVKILPPLAARDVLCVGKNYAEHAKEFNSSGFDSSDKVDQPSHPVIFTKRFTSIIADGEEIYPHPEFTQTADYEGEIGVIIRKPAYRVAEEDAMEYVWGYTIVNDMTARERQRDHKQFYIGKSPDTFCPMGPIAVPASHLDKVLRVQTYVNGELRQDATTDDLIFSIPYLIKTMSEGQTLMPGDVLATGTPAGVGIGRKPPVYLKSGDVVAISVNGLGTLTNRVADSSSPSPANQPKQISHLRQNNLNDIGSSSLTMINNKPLHYKALGADNGTPIVFIHGLGGSTESFTPLVHTLGLEYTHSMHLFDFEGHGLSPTTPLSVISTESLVADLQSLFEHANIHSGAIIVAHSMGCIIAAKFALAHPDRVSKLILLGPPTLPFPEAGIDALRARAEIVRADGMVAVAGAIAAAGTSNYTQSSNPIAAAAVRLSLLGQDAEGYAKACTALASADAIDYVQTGVKTLFVTGSEDGVAPPEVCEGYVRASGGTAELKVLKGVGHWHVFEDLQGVAAAVQEYL